MSAFYLYSATGVLTGPIEFPTIPGVGVQIPENAVQLPKALMECPDGFAWALVDGKPEQLADRRGPVYSTATGALQEWTALGQLPEGFTTIPFPGPYYFWHANAWQLDTAAQGVARTAEVLAERDDRLRLAQARIAPLLYAQEFGDLTEQETAALTNWKRYSVELNRIEQQESFPIDVMWPDLPA